MTQAPDGRPGFCIGIDLGTCNSALAFAPLADEAETRIAETRIAETRILAIPQWDGTGTVTEAATLPSALYRPDQALADHLHGLGTGRGDWVVGRLARAKASDQPGRVIQSAKSWLCHHAADHTASFLPWGSDALPAADKISPVAAAALILGHLRAAWDDRFATDGARFDAQDITITVPASFDAVAQRLTLDAARAAGFPATTRLIEEPQAAFAHWLERHHDDDPWRHLPDPGPGGVCHVLVADIGGGTTDFSLFALDRPQGDQAPRIVRVAVSDHLLLGGDNIDLAIAHFLEPRLTHGLDRLSATQWDHLVAACRGVKERALSEDGAEEDAFAVSVPGRGSGLIGGTLSARLTRAELTTLLLDGFFPACAADDRPERAMTAVREWGLPYARDGRITRHLAQFLHGRPAIDAVLFNGGSLSPRRLRDRLGDLIGQWQNGRRPLELVNDQPDLAVARGAAHHGRQTRRQSGRIEAGAARAVFLEAHHAEAGDASALVCLLPQGAPAEQVFELPGLDLRLRLDRPVRFQIHTSTRHEGCRPGDIVAPDPDAFLALPPLETVARSDGQAGGDAAEASVPVAVIATVNALGLLQVSCRSLDPALDRVWPLDFNLRPSEGAAAAADDGSPPLEPNATAPALAAATAFLSDRFSASAAPRGKVAAPRLLASLEQTLGSPKSAWNAALVRSLWSGLEAGESGRALSVEHEEAWIGLAGFLLRPGFGVARDSLRIESLWRILADGPRFPGKRIALQSYLLWRRLAGGLSRDRQEALLAADRDKIVRGPSAPPELIRMAGAFERIDLETKTALALRFIDTATALIAEGKHAAPYLAALGGILTRTPLHAGPDAVVPPALVERAFEAFRDLDWAAPELIDLPALFLRAARAVDDRRADLPEALRRKIAIRLEKSGVPPARVGRLREVVPVGRTERLGFLGDDVPPGLILGGPDPG